MAARYEELTVEMDLLGFDGVDHATVAVGADIQWRLRLTNNTAVTQVVDVYVDLPELFASKLEWAAASSGAAAATGFTAASTGPHNASLDDTAVSIPPGGILTYTLTTASVTPFYGSLALVARLMLPGNIEPQHYADHKPVWIGKDPSDESLDHDSYDVRACLWALFPASRAGMQPIYDFIEQGYTLADLIRNAHPTLAVNDELEPFNPNV